MKITYNSPVVLTYALICCAVMLLSQTLMEGLNFNYFTLPTRNGFGSVGDWFRMISHIAGHVNWPHLVGNFSIILLIGPLLEEKYGPGKLIAAILITGLITGVLNSLLFSEGLLGASGIAFMMIVLGSMMNIRNGQIPMTFILVSLLYLGSEIYTAITVKDQISQFAHLIGGGCGLVFGFATRK
jgi:membrane associated rhomboid family serine protease